MIATRMNCIRTVVSLINVANNEVLPTLLNSLRRQIAQVSADGVYNTKMCHKSPQ